jgi:Predicted pPIWI-associating nuclease
MSSSHPAAEAWAEWWKQLDLLTVHVRRVKGINVSSRDLRDTAREAVQHYFREVRPHLRRLGVGETKIEELDWVAQYIVKLASGTSRKSTYMRRLRELSTLRIGVETTIEIQAAGGGDTVVLTTATESAIIGTLEKILPTSALSYKQVLQDLGEGGRVSYRGTAAELREVVRELLDHLAPDDEVLRSVKPNKDQKRPTMKQKAVFILKTRGIGETARKPAEDAVTAIEESVGSLARSVYDRGSLATHVATTRREVLTFKGYADAVLADLLEVHK